MSFSILMSIYKSEKAPFFKRAMESIWDEQQLKPSEIVLVLDGPLTKELNREVDVWQCRLGSVLKVVLFYLYLHVFYDISYIKLFFPHLSPQ